MLKFVPQQSILAHNNTVLYFGHGGINGLHEAAHFGVPIVSLPVWADGAENAHRLVELGVAETVTKQSSSREIFYTIKKVLNDER